MRFLRRSAGFFFVSSVGLPPGIFALILFHARGRRRCVTRDSELGLAPRRAARAFPTARGDQQWVASLDWHWNRVRSLPCGKWRLWNGGGNSNRCSTTQKCLNRPAFGARMQKQALRGRLALPRNRNRNRGAGSSLGVRPGANKMGRLFRGVLASGLRH